MRAGEARKPATLPRRMLLPGIVASMVIAGPVGLATAGPASASSPGGGQEMAAGQAVGDRAEVFDHVVEIDFDDCVEFDFDDCIEFDFG